MSAALTMICLISICIAITLINAYFAIRQTNIYKKQADETLKKISESRKHCGYVKTDLPAQITHIKISMTESLETILNSIETISKQSNEQTEKTINEIKRQLSDTLEMIGDIYSFQPKMISDINESYNTFIEKIMSLFLELKNHVLSKQEISRGEYLIFVKLIFDIIVLKTTQINFILIDDETIINYNTKNTQYKSKIFDMISALLESLENVKYQETEQKETKRHLLLLKDDLIDVLYKKMSEYMEKKSLKQINEFNKTEIKSFLSNTVIDICESKKMEVLDLIRG